MNSISVIVSWLTGCALGLLILGRYPAGLDALPAISVFALGLALLVPLIWAREDRNLRLCCLLSMSALFGCARALSTHPPVTPDALAFYNAAPKVTVVGAITGEPVYTDRSQRLRISAEQIQPDGTAQKRGISGDMLVVVQRYPEYNIGERLTISGKLTEPPRISGFDYAAYLARHGVYSYMLFPKVAGRGPGEDLGWKQPLAYTRSAVKRALQRSIAEPEAALAVGVVVGDRSTLPKEVLEAFQRSGATHVLAISGQNIALITGFIWLLYGARKGMRRMSILPAAAVLVGLASYTVFTGAAPAVVRAAVMAAILLLGPIFGRRYDPIAALSVSAFLMGLFDPNVPADAGFQLSFGAMLGITLLSPGIYNFLKRLRIPAYPALAFATSLGAIAATTPISALLSGRLSLVSPLATLTIDIALLPLMVTGIITGIIGVFFPPLAEATGWLVWACGAWMLGGVGFWASLPWADMSAEGLNPARAFIYYAAIGAALWLAANRSEHVRALLGSNKRVAALSGVAISLWLFLLVVVSG